MLWRRTKSSRGLEIITIWSDPLISSTWSGRFFMIIHRWRSVFTNSSFSARMKTRLTEPYFSFDNFSSFDMFSSLYNRIGLNNILARSTSCKKIGFVMQRIRTRNWKSNSSCWFRRILVQISSLNMLIQVNTRQRDIKCSLIRKNTKQLKNGANLHTSYINLPKNYWNNTNKSINMLYETLRPGTNRVKKNI